MSATSKKPAAAAKQPAGRSTSGRPAAKTAPPKTASAKTASARTASARPTPSQQRAARRAEEAAQAARRERQRRLIRVLAPVAVIVVIVVALVVVKLASGGTTPKSGLPTVAAPAAVVQQVTHVPAATFNTVGVGSITTPPRAISGGPALTANGKPQVVYIGGEFCPYCAAERWAIAVALSRFGTLTNLGQTTSSPSDVFPGTASLSFHGATFTSATIAFSGKEIYSNQVSGNHYTALDTLTADESALMKKYDAPPYVPSNSKGAIPFIDIGGKYLISGSSYRPAVLKGQTHAQIAAALAHPTSPIAKGVIGTANVVTAAICQTTAQLPAAVCQSAGVQSATAKLTGSS